MSGIDVGGKKEEVVKKIPCTDSNGRCRLSDRCQGHEWVHESANVAVRCVHCGIVEEAMDVVNRLQALADGLQAQLDKCAKELELANRAAFCRAQWERDE